MTIRQTDRGGAIGGGAWAFGRGAAPESGRALSLAPILLVERDRWALWVPVLLGVGIILYFALPTEPPLEHGIATAVAAFGLALLIRRRPVALIAALGAATVAIGFTAAELRTARVVAPVLE